MGTLVGFLQTMNIISCGFLLAGFVAVGCSISCPPCKAVTTTAGSVSYYLMYENDSRCWTNGCVYSKEGASSDELYCFDAGDFAVYPCDSMGSSPQYTENSPPMMSSTAPSPSPAASTLAPTSSPPSGSVCKCGVKKSSGIVGGTEVNPKNKYPWVAALMSNGGQFCGGTLVASKYVVTAAHCMFLDQDATQAVAAADITVRLGEHDLASTTDTTILKDVKVKTIMNHENYKPATGSLDNDITVLELMEEVDLNTFTPACLAQTTDATTFDGKNAWVYGWGTTSSGGASSSVLLEVELPVVTKATCETAMGPMTDGQICAGGALNKDACQGDSGGPLTYESNGQHVLIGDVSYGDGCGKEGKYGVYGRISFYRTWIEGKISSPKFCGNTANAA